MDLILSVFLVRDTRNINLKFEVDNLFNFDTGVISKFGHVTCPANFKCANYSFRSPILIMISCISLNPLIKLKALLIRDDVMKVVALKWEYDLIL